MKMLIGGLAALLVFIGAAGTALAEEENTEMSETEETEKPEEPVFHVQLAGTGGNLNLSWDEPGGYSHLSYQAVVQVKQGRDIYTEIYRTSVPGNAIQAQNILAYACQENGLSDRMRFVIEAYEGYKLVGSAATADFDPKDYYLEKTEYEFGEDIPRENITGLWWHGTGMSATMNFSYEITRNDEGIMYYASYYDSRGRAHHSEKKLSDKEWEDLADLLVQGRIVRGSIRDPDIVVTDGYSEDFLVTWKGMTEKEEKYCRFQSGPSVSHQIGDLLEKYAKKGGVGWLMAAAAAAGAGAAAWFGRRFFKQE